MAESYQNNSSCRSNEGVQEPTLQRQPTAAGEKKTTTKKRGGGEIVNSHQDISVNGAHQLRVAFPPAAKGGAPYAAPIITKVSQDNKKLRGF